MPGGAPGSQLAIPVTGSGFAGAWLRAEPDALTFLPRHPTRPQALADRLAEAAATPAAADVWARAEADAERLGADAASREAARSLFRADPDRAVAEVLTRLENEGDTFARRFAAIALGSGLEREAPTVFAKALLGTAISGATFPERLFLYLEDDDLLAR